MASTRSLIHAIEAAEDLGSKPAVQRLACVTLGALQAHASRHS